MADTEKRGREGLGRRIVGLFRPYRGRTTLILISIVVTSGLGIVNPLLVQVVFDDALFVAGGPDLSLLYLLVGVMVAIPIVLGVIGVGQTYLTNFVGNRVMQDLRDRLYAHLQSMPLSFFTGTRTGEIQSRLANDVGGVQTVVTSTASSILANVVTVISSLVAMLVLSWQLTLVSLILVPLFVVLTYRVGRLRRAVSAQTQESMAEMSAITQETLSVSGILLSKVFERRSDEIERYRRANERLAELQVRQQMTGQGFFALVQAFFGITPAIIYLVAGLTLAGGASPISAGTIVAFTTLQTRLFFPIVSLLRVSVEIQSSLALFERVFEYLDLEPDIVDAPDAITPGRPAGRGSRDLRLGVLRLPAEHTQWRRCCARREPPPRPRRALAGGRARSAGGPGRAERRRQDDRLLPRAAALRPQLGERADRRHRRAPAAARRAGRDRRSGDPGDATCSTRACATTCSTRAATPPRRRSRRPPERR